MNRAGDIDSDLVARIRAGDQGAWNELVDRHSALLWRLARSIVSDDAAASDAMQTAWMRLLQNIDRLSEPAAVRGWLATTTRREAIAIGRARSRQRPSDPQGWSFDTATPVDDDPGEVSATSERHQIVRSALTTLTEKCRELLTLLAHKVDYKSIGDTLDMPVGSIGPTKSRCMENLRRVPAIAQLEVM